MTDIQTSSKRTALSITFENKHDLYASFMPFVKNGGLFIHTNKEFELGEEVFLLLKLLDDPEQYPIQTKVVWHTPVGAQSSMPAGVGVEFSANSELVRKKIETYLVGTTAGRRTDTM